MTEFAASVHEAVRRIPAGRVASYGAIAREAGRPWAARGVGSALRGLPADTDVPWWRVVSASGRLTIPTIHHGRSLQQALLADEGVDVVAGRVDMARVGWSTGTED